ncbi:hypothetical protein [Acidomonas methanolica]|nr:hypothetical protein [Acidomonas methanolica]MCQ9155840.1 hypothetical protein [Acidomonas methanolica]
MQFDDAATKENIEFPDHLSPIKKQFMSMVSPKAGRLLLKKKKQKGF